MTSFRHILRSAAQFRKWLCAAALIPVFLTVHCAAYWLRFEGQLSVFENSAGEPCYRCLYSDDDELLGDCAGNGVLAPVPGVIGALMASEALQLVIAGHSARNGQLTLWDAISGRWQTIKLKPNPDCPVCSKKKKRL